MKLIEQGAMPDPGMVGVRTQYYRVDRTYYQAELVNERVTDSAVTDLMGNRRSGDIQGS